MVKVTSKLGNFKVPSTLDASAGCEEMHHDFLDNKTVVSI